MPSIASLLKDEIVRLARKEIKRELEHLRKQVTAHRTALAALKRQVAEGERKSKQTARVIRAVAPQAPKVDEGKALRFSAKGLKTLREKLGLSANDFGRLVGVSQQSIYNWEAGSNRPRPTQLHAIQGLRNLGKRDAAAKLAALDG